MNFQRQLTSEKCKYEEMVKQKDRELTGHIADSVELKKKLIKLIKYVKIILSFNHSNQFVKIC